MPNPWPDPLDDKPEPRWLVWLVAATLVCFFAVNIVRGLMGFGFNW